MLSVLCCLPYVCLPHSQVCVDAMLPSDARSPADTEALKASLARVDWKKVSAPALFTTVSSAVGKMFPGLFTWKLEHLLAYVVSATPVLDTDVVVPAQTGMAPLLASDAIRQGLVFGGRGRRLEMPLLWLTLVGSRHSYTELHPEFSSALRAFVARLPFWSTTRFVGSAFEDFAAQHMALVAMAHRAVRGSRPRPLRDVFPGAILTPSANAIQVQFTQPRVTVVRSMCQFPESPPRSNWGTNLLPQLLDGSMVVLNGEGAPAFDAALYLPTCPPEWAPLHDPALPCLRLLLQAKGYKEGAITANLVREEDEKSRRALARMAPGSGYLPEGDSHKDVTVLLSYGRRPKGVDIPKFRGEVAGAIATPRVVVCHEFGFQEYFGMFGRLDCFIASGRGHVARVLLLCSA